MSLPLPAALLRMADRNSDERAALEAVMCSRSFKAFCRAAWRDIDPAPLKWNWHIDAICEELEAAARREVRELVINLPPRIGKSLITGVAFPAWVATWHPAAKFITCSYEMTLATRDAVKTRRLLLSAWYQKRWGVGSPFIPKDPETKRPIHEGVALMHDQNNKTFYETTAGGSRFCGSPGTMVTGHGADFILCLPGDQLIRTDRGVEQIGDVVRERAATHVLAFDHETGEATMKPIVAFEVHPPRELVEIETDDGHILRCTVDHPVWVEGRGYIPAGEVRPDDEVLVCPAACIA